MKMELFGVVAEKLHGFPSDMFSLIFRQNGQPNLCAEMYGIEVCQVGEPYRGAVTFNHQSHLTVGKDIVLRRGDILTQRIAGLGHSRCAEAPKLRFVLDSIDELEIFRFKGTQ